MAQDRLVTEGGTGVTRRLKDMGDGSFAEVVYAVGITGGTGGVAEAVAVHDGTNPLFKLAVDADGRLAVVVANPTAAPETGLAKEATLAALLTELGQKLEPGQAVALDAATLAALETINAVVSGTVAVSNLPATQPVSGTVAVSNFPSPASSVSVSNFPATQPVSGSVSVGNFPATQPVSGSVAVSNLPATQQVSGSVAVSNFPATQPVSGTVTVANPTPAAPAPLTAPLAVTAVGAAGAAVTLTLPAAGAGLFHYLTSLEVTLYNAAARTGGATPVTATTTNLPGALALTFPSAGAVGTIDRYIASLDTPLRASAAATATTVVCPATTGVIWRATATYYTAA